MYAPSTASILNHLSSCRFSTDPIKELNMRASNGEGPLGPGDRPPNVVLDAVTREGKVALDDFRGRSPVLVGLYRGLHCPFCRRHIAALARLEPALRERGVQSLAVVNTPVARARLYFRFHPMPTMLAAADPARVSHQAFGLPNLQFVEGQTEWPYRVGMDDAMALKVDLPGELPEPMRPNAAAEILNRKDGYEMTDAETEVSPPDRAQLVGQFLLDRDGVVRWSFTEVANGGANMFGAASPGDLLAAAAEVTH
jgi:peroxiredoxin